MVFAPRSSKVAVVTRLRRLRHSSKRGAVRHYFDVLAEELHRALRVRVAEHETVGATRTTRHGQELQHRI